ncbi:hypothetical protein BU26DRAFT_300490 [Trematosphaeria pertusa]|uniref:RRM domain-containing protein n=1 Tax=Trematosphaeria pertusa TaxID=390896 RepID=A0A6A6ILD7_9PLEO|nr:uncharacterized protein BU26DRAFT_300490 [Trematosphaeria pertusa]KAF2250360.1 hypothetical protein BU26DRAFT_300490 [Trematosphaeria pertusa]
MRYDKIFLKNIPPGTTKEYIHALYAAQGARKAGIPSTMRGCAIVTFDTEEQARRAVRESALLRIQGRQVHVSMYVKTPTYRHNAKRAPAGKRPETEGHWDGSDADDETVTEEGEAPPSGEAYPQVQKEAQSQASIPDIDRRTEFWHGYMTIRPGDARTRFPTPPILKAAGQYREELEYFWPKLGTGGAPRVPESSAEASEGRTPVPRFPPGLEPHPRYPPGLEPRLETPDATHGKTIFEVLEERAAKADLDSRSVHSDIDQVTPDTIPRQPAQIVISTPPYPSTTDIIRQRHLSSCHLCKRMAQGPPAKVENWHQ